MLIIPILSDKAPTVLNLILTILALRALEEPRSEALVFEIEAAMHIGT